MANADNSTVGIEAERAHTNYAQGSADVHEKYPSREPESTMNWPKSHWRNLTLAQRASIRPLAFLAFPAEIRNYIYEVLLVENDGRILKFIPDRHFDVYTENLFPMKLSPDLDDLGAFDLTSHHMVLPKGLVASCRQLYDEIVPLAYAKPRICVVLMHLYGLWDNYRAQFGDGQDLRFSQLKSELVHKLTIVVWQDPNYPFLKGEKSPKACSADLVNLATLKQLPRLMEVSCSVLLENHGIGTQLMFDFVHTTHDLSGALHHGGAPLGHSDLPTEEVQRGLDFACDKTILPIYISELVRHTPPGASFSWFDALDHGSPNSAPVAGLGIILHRAYTGFVPTSETRKKTWFRDLTGPRDDFEVVPKNVLRAIQQRLEKEGGLIQGQDTC